jgi:hypothetical protein
MADPSTNIVGKGMQDDSGVSFMCRQGWGGQRRKLVSAFGSQSFGSPRAQYVRIHFNR